MSKCSKTSYFYFCFRSELCDVPGSSGVIVRHSPSFIFKFFTSCFSPSSSFSSSFKVAGILFYNCRLITKKLPLRILPALVMHCCFVLVLLLLWFWDSSGFLVLGLIQAVYWFCRYRWNPFVFVNYIYLESLATHGSWLL